MSAMVDVERLYSVGVVVRDLERAAARYAEIFGLDVWDVREFDAARLSNTTSHGRPTEPCFRTATATTTPPPGPGFEMIGGVNAPVTFELVQPLTGESPFQEFRFVRGQGISHMNLAVMSSESFADLRGRLAGSGIPIAASMTVDGRLERHFLDTRKALGGFLVEVQVPLEPGAEMDVAGAERWDLSGTYSRPEGVGPIGVYGVNHFGVVVDDVMSSLGRYSEVLGINEFRMRDWRTEKGLLEDPYYRCEAVDHEYFTGRAALKDFGFEIIQPTLGPSHYNREFHDLWGEGIHHMLLNMAADESEWDAVRDWLATIDVPVAMGADLYDGAVSFCYYDTFESLGGYILEAVVAKHQLDPAAATPHFIIDFARLTADL